jgi:hypothetical protein
MVEVAQLGGPLGIKLNGYGIVMGLISGITMDGILIGLY